MMPRSRKAQLRDEALLVAFAERLLETAAAAEPRATFQSSLRTSLLMEASTALIDAPGRPRPQPARPARALPRRRLAIVTALVATTLGLGGIASASASALPGEALYPVKRATEQIELAFQRGNAASGAFHLELAERRLTEAEALPEGEPEFGRLATESVRDFDEQAEAGTDDILTAFREDNSRSSMVVLNRFAAKADALLAELETKLPQEAAAALADARERLNSIVGLSERLCPDCGGTPTGAAAPSPAEPGGPAGAEPAPQPAAPPAAAPSVAIPPYSSNSSSSAGTEDEEDEDEEDEAEDELRDNDDLVPVPGLPTATPRVPTPTQTDRPCNNQGNCDGNNGQGRVTILDPIFDVVDGVIGNRRGVISPDSAP